MSSLPHTIVVQLTLDGYGPSIGYGGATGSPGGAGRLVSFLLESQDYRFSSREVRVWWLSFIYRNCVCMGGEQEMMVIGYCI